MKICMFTRIMPAHSKGGMQDHILMLAKAVAKKENRVVVVTTRHPDGIEHETIENVDVFYIKETVPGSYGGGWWDASLKKFNELSEFEAFDVVHSQSIGGYYFLKKELNEKFSLPVVISIHGTGIDEIKTRCNFISWHKPLYIIKSILFVIKEMYNLRLPRFAIDRADMVIATSNEQAIILKKFYAARENNTSIVLNGIDVNLFAPSRKSFDAIWQKYGISSSENLLLSIARLEKDKGIQNIIHALPLILKELTETKLVIVGDGGYALELKKLVRKLKLENNVIFTGMLPFESLPDYFNTCDLFVNPTIRQNGYDLTILEAMACEKPVVVSNIGSVPTVIEDGVDGLLVPTGDIKKLAEAVIKVLKDQELAQRLGKAARKKIVEKFSIESMVEGTINVYEEVIRRNKEKVSLKQIQHYSSKF